jgi:hypothetical protein
MPLEQPLKRTVSGKHADSRAGNLIKTQALKLAGARIASRFALHLTIFCRKPYQAAAQRQNRRAVRSPSGSFHRISFPPDWLAGSDIQQSHMRLAGPCPGAFQ